MRDIKKLIDKIKNAKSAKGLNREPIVFEKIKNNKVVPKDFSNELYLMCFRDGFMFTDETVAMGDYMGTTVYVGGEISYETVLNNRGIGIAAVEECYLTLYNENDPSEDYQGGYEIYSLDTGVYIGTYEPTEGEFRIPLKKLYDVCGNCNFLMIPCEDYSGLAIFSQDNYSIEVTAETHDKDFYNTSNFPNEPDYQQNYFEGDVANAGSYSVNNHNGRLSFSKTLFALDGNKLPMSLRMVYNPFIHKGIQGIFEDNWKFNFEQFVYEKDGDYIYIDNDFRRHVFKPLLDAAGNYVSGQYYDTAHSGLLLQVNSDHIIITDGRLSELKFVDNRLTQIKERVGSNTYNTLTVSYNNGIIGSVTDGMGRTTYFTKSGSTITITMPTGDKITVTESTGLELTVRDVDFAVYRYSYSLLNDVNVLTYVSEEARRRIKFEYGTGSKIEKITVSNPKITLATYEFTYNGFANHTDIKKTELNKKILERYSMTEEGRLIYSCELQNEKSYSLSFRTQEDYNTYAAALTGENEGCAFGGEKGVIDVPDGSTLNRTAESESYSVAKDGEDVVLVANVLVDTEAEAKDAIDIEIGYGTPSIMIPFATVKVKRIKDPQTIIVPIPKNAEGFYAIFQAADYKRLFSFASSKKLPFGLKIFNVGYYFTRISANAECINQNTGSAESFNDVDGNTTWYKLTNPIIDGVTPESVKMTSEDWQLSLDNYARNSADYIVWYNERTAATKFSAPAKFIFAGSGSTNINAIKYATITNQGINTLYDSFTYNNSSETEYITETKTLVRKESTMRSEPSATTCYIYFNKLYRQTKAIDSFGIETVSEYDRFGNLTSSVTQNDTLNIKENYTYGNANGASGDGEYLIQSDSYMQGQTLSSKYRYEQNTGRMKNSTSPVGQSTDYAYENSGELKTLSSTLNGTTSKNELTYDIDRIKTAKHNDFVYNFTYGNTYEELRSITVGDYKLCDQGQVSDNRTTKYYPNNQDISYYTDKYGRQEGIIFYGDGNYQGMVNFRYGLPDQPNVNNAQSKLLGIDIHLYVGVHEYASATFVYEANGNLKKLYWFDFYSLEYTYDDENRVKTQSYIRAGTSIKTEYTYWDGDALTGARITDTKVSLGETPIGTTHDDYDRLNRLEYRTRILDGHSNLEFITYTGRTVNGRGTTYLPDALKQTIDSHTYDEQFAYDKNGNIISIKKSGGEITYEYDKFNRLIRENNQVLNKTFTYEYNKGGNITAKKEYTYTTGALGSPTATHSYTYDNTYKDLLIAYDGQTITYDGTARPTSYKGNNLSWRLGNLFEYGDTTFEYLYDNTRLSKKSGNTVTTYDYHNGRLLGEHYSGNDGTKDISYFYDHAGIIGFTLNGTVYRYIKNLQGDILAIYKGATKVAEYAYDAWGNCTVKQDTDGIGTFNAIRYRGYYYDVETGLYYLMSRYYDPATGRFISPDDISYLDPETIQGLNLFAYCGNNPVMGRIISCISSISNPYRGGISYIYSISIPSVSIPSVPNLPISNPSVSSPSVPNSSISNPFANNVLMTNYSSSLVNNKLFGILIGNISFIRTTQHNEAGTFYSFINTGSSNSAGAGFNLGWYGRSIYVTDNIGIGSSVQIGDFSFSGEVSLLEGLTISVGITSGNVTDEISVNIGWLLLRGIEVVTGFYGLSSGLLSAIKTSIASIFS